jgi:hypothetical protein
MREEVLRTLMFPVDSVGKDNKALALLVDRRGTGRNINNTDELVEIIRQ